jgi:magnesium transporter
MNVRHMPELDWPFGYPPALGILLLTNFVLRWNLRRVGWL